MPPIPTPDAITPSGHTAPRSEPEVLLELRGLKTHFHTDDGVVRAVDGVDFALRRGRTLGIVGESGCGKTILSRSIIRTLPAAARLSGEIGWRRKDGKVVDLTRFTPDAPELRSIRGKEIAMIFQEPMRSLSPAHSIGDQVSEMLLTHERVSRREARSRSVDMLRLCGITDPEAAFDSYPFEMSGGMRQRAMIAMALMCRPDLLIADEPTTALDVTVAAAILKLLRRLQRDMGMAVMIITHDLGVVAQMADDVVVMYLGKVVESGPVERIFAAPQHPYTQALMRSMPSIGGRRDTLETIRGSVPGPFAAIQGCPFSPRCREVVPAVCTKDVPPLVEVGAAHRVRCFMREGVPL